MRKLLTVAVCCLLLVACGQKNNKVNMEKDGTEYTVGDNVSFYYPNSFSVDMNAVDSGEEASSTINFESKEGSQMMYFVTKNDVTDNASTDKSELYKGELEQSGASQVKLSQPHLESGLDCYEYTGYVKTTKIRFKCLAYFGENTTYIYGFQASDEEYKDNVKTMTVFIESFNLKTGKSK